SSMPSSARRLANSSYVTPWRLSSALMKRRARSSHPCALRITTSGRMQNKVSIYDNFSVDKPNPYVSISAINMADMEMSNLSRDQQIQAISALTEGVSIRATERLTGVHRDTIMRLGVRVGQGCAAVHDSLMRGLQVNRVEIDEVWAFVGKKRTQVKPGDGPEVGDQYA